MGSGGELARAVTAVRRNIKSQDPHPATPRVNNARAHTGRHTDARTRAGARRTAGTGDAVEGLEQTSLQKLAANRHALGHVLRHVDQDVDQAQHLGLHARVAVRRRQRLGQNRAP